MRGFGRPQVVMAVTETSIKRPKRRQRQFYSGKKKRHTLKSQLVIDQTPGHIICTYFGKGRRHDFKLFQTSGVHFHRDSESLQDKAYQGIQKLRTNSSVPKNLQQLKEQLPLRRQNWERLQGWWQQNYPAWVERVRATIAHYRNIHHLRQFTPEQQQVLQHYYDANQLLMGCLNSNCEVTATIRQEIEGRLLLPQQALEDRKWQGD